MTLRRHARQAFRGLAWLLFLPPAVSLAAETAGELKTAAVPGFAEATDTELFRSLRAEFDPNGVPLAICLPDAMNQLYRAGRGDAVTRQVLLYGTRGKDLPDKRDAELMARTLAGAYAGYERPAAETGQDREALARFHRSHTDAGTSVWAEEGQTDNSFFFTLLFSYPTGTGRPLVTALCTALVPVAGRVVFISASSLVTDDAPQDHLNWVKNTADAFAEMLISANRG
jgi:hypothetical protein